MALLLTAGAGCRQKAPASEHFGDPFTQAPRVMLAQLIATPDAFQRKTMHISGMIERQCPSAGCWFFLRDDQGHSVRVELGDYFERLPQNVGNAAEVEGEWIAHGSEHEFVGTRVSFLKKASR